MERLAPEVKSGIISEIIIPLLPELAKIIAAGWMGDVAFIATPTGRPMTTESFGNWFEDPDKAAVVPGPARGLRKAGARRAQTTVQQYPTSRQSTDGAWQDGSALHQECWSRETRAGSNG
ncbi:MAG: hypothetical protein WBF43_01050 [Methylocella sp.]